MTDEQAFQQMKREILEHLVFWYSWEKVSDPQAIVQRKKHLGTKLAFSKSLFLMKADPWFYPPIAKIMSKYGHLGQRNTERLLEELMDELTEKPR